MRSAKALLALAILVLTATIASGTATVGPTISKAYAGASATNFGGIIGDFLGDHQMEDDELLSASVGESAAFGHVTSGASTSAYFDGITGHSISANGSLSIHTSAPGPESDVGGAYAWAYSEAGISVVGDPLTVYYSYTIMNSNVFLGSGVDLGSGATFSITPHGSSALFSVTVPANTDEFGSGSFQADPGDYAASAYMLDYINAGGFDPGSANGTEFYTFTLSTAPIPEPSAALGVSVVSLLGYRSTRPDRRRKCEPSRSASHSRY